LLAGNKIEVLTKDGSVTLTIKDGLSQQNTRIDITAPSDVVTTPIDLTTSQAYTLLTDGYILDNVELGYLIDDYLQDGIWTIKYTPYFNSDFTGTLGDTAFKFVAGIASKQHFINATDMIIDGTYVKILSVTYTATECIVLTDTDMTGFDLTNPLIGIGTTTYTSITKELKECLDNKIADESLCPCDCGDCSLVQKYLLYEAIELNCKQNNYTKANQIFTYLTELSTNCGC